MKDGSGDLDFGREDTSGDDETEGVEQDHGGDDIESESVAGDEGTADENTDTEGAGVGSSNASGGTEASSAGDGAGIDASSGETGAAGGNAGGTDRTSGETGVETERGSHSETAADDRGTRPTSGVESKYPYLVRRSNVGDERGKRLEVHVREHVADREASFRSHLAELLGTDEVSKTDAREFALVAAMEHPELVAEQMRAEGFDELG